jgi:hypothetical protein
MLFMDSDRVLTLRMKLAAEYFPLYVVLEFASCQRCVSHEMVWCHGLDSLLP